MKDDLTEKKDLSSASMDNCAPSLNTSKHSRRTTNYAQVLLTWDETAKRGLSKEEQKKVYEQLRTKFGIE